MSDVYKVTHSDMVSVADALRERTQTSDLLVFPNEFVTAISNLGGSGATLTVTTPAEGIAVTVAKGELRYTKTTGADGTAVFSGLETGMWEVTITDGSETAQKTVSIYADYETFLTLFSSTINITYPSGLDCTATDGVTTMRAPDTSGVWACIVPNAGTWTVTVEQKGWTDTVEITESGQTVQVDLDQLYIYKNGVLKYTLHDKGKSYWINADGKLTGHSDKSASGAALIIGFNEKLGDIDRIYIRAKVINTDTNYHTAFVSNYNKWPDSFNNKLASVDMNTGSENTYSINLSSISGDIYLWMAWSAYAKDADVEIYEIRGV